ncbi:MAG TPA: JAB domain-containing protein [Niabella sp.]|nr:JAB domain-containing protein [Niabella sp.]
MNLQDWTQVAEIEISYNPKVKPSQRPTIRNSADIYKILQELWNKNLLELQEEFKVLLLNRRNKILGVYNASVGGIGGTVADPKLILAAAIKSGASALILSHNHPSGEASPSRADETLTQKIKMAASFFDMRLLDHIIITTEGYFSFADEGIL